MLRDITCRCKSQFSLADGNTANVASQLFTAVTVYFAVDGRRCWCVSVQAGSSGDVPFLWVCHARLRHCGPVICPGSAFSFVE